MIRSTLRAWLSERDMPTLRKMLSRPESNAARDSNGRDLLALAASCQNLPATLLLRHAFDLHDSGAWLLAAAGRDPAILTALAQDGLGRRPDGADLLAALHAACSAGRPANALALARLGADASQADLLGRSAIHHAALAGEPRGAILMLAERGCDIEQPDAQGDRPLHLACSKKGLLAVRELVRLGADIESRDGSGSTPLMLAAQCSAGLVCFLLDCGANPLATDPRGARALERASARATASPRSAPIAGSLLSRLERDAVAPLQAAQASHPARGSKPRL